MKDSVLWWSVRLGLLVVGMSVLTGCQTAYNATMEHVFGYEKRELLKKSVVALRDEQKETEQEFKDALTRLKELYGFQGGQVETVYNKLKSSYDGCESQAKDLHSRIENMENIAQSMFSEWDKEIGQYSNATLASKSRQQLQDTKQRYAQLSQSVRRAETSIQPVLSQLKDNVLFLKHNLNAAAIGSLQGEASNIQTQIDHLIKSINASIAEADDFIKTLPQ